MIPSGVTAEDGGILQSNALPADLLLKGWEEAIADSMVRIYTIHSNMIPFHYAPCIKILC